MLEFSEWHDAPEDQLHCQTVMKSDRIADLYIDLTPLKTITDSQRRFSYVDVLNSLHEEFKKQLSGLTQEELDWSPGPGRPPGEAKGTVRPEQLPGAGQAGERHL